MTPSPTSTTVSGGGTASLTVVNSTSTTIYYLYISPSSSADWGDDQLGASTIAAGGSYTFSGITPGSYDLKAEDSSHTVMKTAMSFTLSAGANTWTVTSGGSGTASLTVVNSTSTVIYYMYISPDTSPSWGDDQLGSGTIPAGGSYTFSGITPGSYDLKAEDSSHNVISSTSSVALTAGTNTWTVTSGVSGTASLTVVNSTSTSIWYMYISPDTSPSWGDDRLGSDTIPAGGSYTFSGITPGSYDLKAEDSSHNVISTIGSYALAEGTNTWTVCTGSTASLTVVNSTSTVIYYLYISPSSSSSWGDDQLGVATIPAGGRYSFSCITPGSYDLKAENSSHSAIRTSFNVTLTAGMNTWTVTP